MPLTGAQYEDFVTALVNAFPNATALAMMLKFRLNKQLDAIVPPGSTTHQAFYLIQASEAEGWTDDLLKAARKSRPANALLLALAQSIGAPTNVPAGPELEKVIKASNRFYDIDKWRQSMGAIEAQVCQISIPTNKGTIKGTGFLVGPDVVMTNYHVVDSVIAGMEGKQTASGRSAKASDVVCLFDYKRKAGYLNKGIEIKLADDWLIDSSPVSAIDHEPEPKSGDPKLDELDYALLRLARKCGAEPVVDPGEKAELEADKRGWITVPTTQQKFVESAPMFIVQHPDGDPLVFTLDTSGVIGPNGNSTRVKYTTNTRAGSSGSPCFNDEWELVALHHSGDPNFDPATKPKYNEGIPMAAIRSALRSRNLETVLDA